MVRSAHAAGERGASPEKPLPAGAEAAPPTPCLGDLEAVSAAAECIFDLAKAGKWNGAGIKLEELRKSVQPLRLIQYEESTMLLPRLKNIVFKLDRAVAARNRRDTMRYANKVTLIEAVMVGPLKPRIPTDVMLLDYYGRELEIRSEGGKPDRLASVVVRMHLTWQSLMPHLVIHGGTREVKKFADIMKRLETAKTPEEYGRLALEVRGEVKTLKKYF